MSTQTQRPLKETIHPVVFPVSAAIIVAIVVATIVATDTMGDLFLDARSGITANFGWLMIGVMALLLGVSIYLAVGPYGRIKLGPDDSTPDYSTAAWFAMLFSAGMGIGLVFWGTAEPAFLVGNDAFAGLSEQEQSREAMRFVFHHWGFSPWAVYAIVGLGLAYFGFRRGMPMTIRSLFHPLLGDRVNGPIGHAIDILAVVATIFGIATSLGLGAQQVAAGMGRVFDIDITGSGGLVMIIAVITAFATVSVVLGLDKGIKRLSQINIVAATGLALVVLLLGPTLLLVTAFVDNTGYYVQNMIHTLAFTGSYEAEASGLVEGWTVFYWAWWISWSPFVGMFIARVSRGRTIREFVIGVLVAPTMVSFAWFTIFGNSTLENPDVVAGIGEVGEAEGMFVLLDSFGLGGGVTTALSLLVIFVVVVFFVTSSDSGSFVVDMLTSGGDLDPAVQTRVFWAVTEGLVAIALLTAGGDQALLGLQAGAVSAGFPFAILLIFATWGLLRGLKSERPPRPRGGDVPLTVAEATRREQEARELEMRAQELAVKERELDIREAELAAQGQADGRQP